MGRQWDKERWWTALLWLQVSWKHRRGCMYAIPGDSQVSNSAVPLALPRSSFISSIWMATACQGSPGVYGYDTLLPWVRIGLLRSVLQLELDQPYESPPLTLLINGLTIEILKGTENATSVLESFGESTDAVNTGHWMNIFISNSTIAAITGFEM